jgi:hypothetical protein
MIIDKSLKVQPVLDTGTWGMEKGCPEETVGTETTGPVFNWKESSVKEKGQKKKCGAEYNFKNYN